MSDFTDYTETAIRDWMSQGTTMPSAPSNLHVALHTSDPGESPDGSAEVGAGDYSRSSTTTGTDWDTTSNPTTFENANEVNFGQATSNWGTISHVSLWDGSSASDNCLASYALDSDTTIETDDTFVFNSGDLSFEIQ